MDTDHTNWVDAIDVCEHHCIDFDAVAAQGNRIVVARAGRGTRQDARWIEPVRAARVSRLDVASYWHLYPSHTTPHHQAELWVVSIRGASGWPFTFGHWADISSSDGFDPFELGRYVASFLRRADELLGDTVGVFATDEFWDRHVRFDDPVRGRWRDASGGVRAPGAFGVRTIAADRGGPGRHLVRASGLTIGGAPASSAPALAVRGATETVTQWRARWVRTPEVTHLQTALNAMGAELAVDGVFGPATDAAVRTCGLLCRRDRVDWPLERVERRGSRCRAQSSRVISRTRASSTSSAGRLSPPSGMITSA